MQEMLPPGTVPGVSTTFTGLAFRLDPTNVQYGHLAGMVGAARFCYNQCVDIIKFNQAVYSRERDLGVASESRTPALGFGDLRRWWTTTKPDWTGKYSWWLFDQAQRDAQKATSNWMKGLAKFPRFKAKHKAKQRFTVIGRECVVEAGRLRLPKFGWIRICSPDPGQTKLRRLLRAGKAKLLSVTITLRPDGTVWATVKVERTTTWTPPPPSPVVVGVDVGAVTHAVAATSSGTVVVSSGAARRRRDNQPGITRSAQQMARRRVKGWEQSNGYVKAKRRHAKRHGRAAARRDDDLHVLSKQIVDCGAGFIVRETLNVDDMLNTPEPIPDPTTEGGFLPNGAARATARNAAVADASLATLHRYIDYKAERGGVIVLTAQPYFPSSKLCPDCSAVKPKLPDATRTITCHVCGHTRDRDERAAVNLAVWGEIELFGEPTPGTGTHPDGQATSTTATTTSTTGCNQPPL